MTAIIWQSSRICRAIVRDSEGRPIDMVDEWNNVASTQSYLNDAYPDAAQTVVRDFKQFRELDMEWVRCKTGNG